MLKYRARKEGLDEDIGREVRNWELKEKEKTRSNSHLENTRGDSKNTDRRNKWKIPSLSNI